MWVHIFHPAERAMNYSLRGSRMSNERILNKYCSECERLTNFEKVAILEKVKVKNSDLENEHLYYKCSHCNELFEPFEDPDYNARLDFDKYKQLKKEITMM